MGDGWRVAGPPATRHRTRHYAGKEGRKTGVAYIDHCGDLCVHTSGPAQATTRLMVRGRRLLTRAARARSRRLSAIFDEGGRSMARAFNHRRWLSKAVAGIILVLAM